MKAVACLSSIASDTWAYDRKAETLGALRGPLLTFGVGDCYCPHNFPKVGRNGGLD
jgi:hypothetical protein